MIPRRSGTLTCPDRHRSEIIRSKILALTLVLSSFAAPSLAAEIRDCRDANIDLTSMVMPPSANVVTTYDGQVALYNVDIIEPACCSAAIAIVLPDTESELHTSKCVAITGFREVDIARAPRSYDPRRGLLIKLPTVISTNDGNGARGPTLRIRINLAKSSVELEN